MENKELKTPFSGSYTENDVEILLKPVEMPFMSIEEKEKLIQAGKHYSELLSLEQLPSEKYFSLFEQAMQRHSKRFAHDILKLAKLIARDYPENIVLISLARAGTPVGVLLKRALALLGRVSEHYSLSIIRDKGIDTEALQYILKTKKAQGKDCVFIDGWTGKGVITRELKKSIEQFNTDFKEEVSSNLYVISDLCGYADMAATNEDYLIPSSLLNAVISGLISRSILNEDLVKENDFHACVYYEQWKKEDISRSFVDIITKEIEKILEREKEIMPLLSLEEYALLKQGLQKQSKDFLEHCLKEYSLTDVNLIKPGIGEATRVFLRRMPQKLLVKEKNQDTLHIIQLAEEKNVEYSMDPHLPYTAVGLIKMLSQNK